MNSCGGTGGKRLQGLKKSFTQPSILLIDRPVNVWPLYPVVSDLTDQARGMDHKEKETKKVKVRQGSHGDIMQVEDSSLVNQSCKVFYSLSRFLFHCIFMRFNG